MRHLQSHVVRYIPISCSDSSLRTRYRCPPCLRKDGATWYIQISTSFTAATDIPEEVPEHPGRQHRRTDLVHRVTSGCCSFITCPHTSDSKFLIGMNIPKMSKSNNFRTSGHGNLEPQTPVSGVLSLLPYPWIPYAELMRVHKPAGVIVIYLPYLLGYLFTATVSSHPAPPSEIAFSAAVLYVTSFLLRSAGCTWNDFADYKFDQKVERCRTRPIARGAVSPFNAAIFFSLQAAVWIIMLWSLCAQTVVFAVPAIGLTMLYPYAKRVTDYPQMMLGLTLAWGLFIGSVMSDPDSIALITEDPRVGGAFGCLFLAYVVWTGVYDTIYGFQDVQDDVKSGVRSMAVRWQHHGKLLLASMAIVQVIFLALAGCAIEVGSGYYSICCGASAAALGIMLWRIDLGSAAECGWWFKNGIMAVGASMTLGVVQEYMRRYTLS